jgi:hypothetical protein
MADEIAPESLEDIAQQAAIGAALARGGRTLRSAALSIGVPAIALGIVLLRPEADRMALTLIILTAAQAALLVVGLYLDLRTSFDADLLADLARAPDLARFDAAMVALGLVPAAKSGRAMRARMSGVKRLLVLQAGGVAAQLALFLGLLVRGGGP